MALLAQTRDLLLAWASLNSLSGGRGDLVQQYVNEAVPLPKKADPYVCGAQVLY
jgi:hypothetical protein